MKIRFGTGGNPARFYDNGGKASVEMPKYLYNLGLDAYEFECSKGVKISEEKAKVLGENAKQNDILISIHSQYYISLSSVEEEKRDKSIDYIMQCMKLASKIGSKRIVVHSGSVSKSSRETALLLAKDTIKRALFAADNDGYNDIHICPETMGKINQLGTLEEVLDICSIDDRLIPTLDFGHLNARTLGGIKSITDYEEIFNKIENKLGFDRLKIFHSHFSKIEYSKGGEKRHLTFDDTEFGPDYEPLMELIYKKGLTPVIICESAGTQDIDALLMKDYYYGLL